MVEMLANGRAATSPIAEMVKKNVEAQGNVVASGPYKTIQGGKDDIKIDDALAEKGKKIILDTVRKGAELSRQIFEIVRECESPEYVEGTFKVAEARALKVIKDAQDAHFKKLEAEGKAPDEKPIRTLSDIAKVQGGAGAASYIAVKARYVKWVNDSDSMVKDLQDWFNFQAKHDGEPQMAVQPDLLNPWSKRYAGNLGWQQFSRDARLCENSKNLLTNRKRVLERQKGRQAAAETGQHGEQTQQGMASGVRQRGNLPDSIQACLNAVIKAVQSSYETIETETLNGILSQCVSAIGAAYDAANAAIKAKAQESSSVPSPGIAEATSAPVDAVSEGDGSGSDTETTVSDPATGETEGAGPLVKPDWIDQADWDASEDAERYEMMSDKEAYLEEKELMSKIEEKGAEQTDAGSNEPSPEGYVAQ